MLGAMTNDGGSGYSQLAAVSIFIADTLGRTYSLPMKRWLVSLCLLVTASILGTGCGGISANGSASPATFLIPGIGQSCPLPKSPAVAPTPESQVLVAQR